MFSIRFYITLLFLFTQLSPVTCLTYLISFYTAERKKMNPYYASVDTEISNSPSAYHATRLEETDAVFCSEWNQRESIPVTRSIRGMDTEVFNAAREGNIDVLREQSGHLHQLLTPTRNTVLHVYISCVGSARFTKSEDLLKSAEVVKEMIKMCQRLLLQQNTSGDTALHLAARHGCAEIVEALIQAAKEWHGDLEEGISSREVCHQFLIRRNNKKRNTALHEAVQFHHHLHVVMILTREDLEFLYSVNDAGETPIFIAAEKGYFCMVSRILDICTSPSYQGPDGYTALHAAAAYGNEHLTRRLLEKEMTLAIAVDIRGFTPLHMAVYGGHASIVKQILECDKSTAYIGNIHKVTPVHLAAFIGHVDALKQLNFFCPDSFELADNKGRNALHYAIIGNENEVEKFVREDPWLSSVLLNSKDFEGNTPLHLIADSRKYNGFNFISDDRVDKMTFNNKNQNARDIVLEETEYSLRKTHLNQGLRDAGAKISRRVSKHSEVDVSKVEQESKYKELKESHLVVSTLIATVTFAAGFTVPGGYQSEKGPDQGFAVLSRNAAFKAFVLTNTVAMSMSSCAVMIRFFMMLMRRELTYGSVPYGTALGLTMYALIAMVIAFVTGTYAVLGGHSSLGLAIGATFLGCFFFFAVGALLFVPAFATLRRYVAIIDYYFITFVFHFLHGNFKRLVPKYA